METSKPTSSRRSYAEGFECVETLDSWVVDDSGPPRIHGYDVESDLAPNYGFVDLLLLSLTGELPDDGASRAVEIVMSFLAPVSSSDGPAHVAVLASLCAAPYQRVVEAGAIGLAEAIGCDIDDVAEVLRWLDDPTTPFPERHRVASADEGASVQRLHACLQAQGTDVPVFAQNPSRLAACVGVLHHAGLIRPIQIATVFIVAQLPAVAAEAAAVRPLGFRDYPLWVPKFRYAEEGKSSGR